MALKIRVYIWVIIFKNNILYYIFATNFILLYNIIWLTIKVFVEKHVIVVILIKDVTENQHGREPIKLRDVEQVHENVEIINAM